MSVCAHALVEDGQDWYVFGCEGWKGLEKGWGVESVCVWEGGGGGECVSGRESAGDDSKVLSLEVILRDLSLCLQVTWPTIPTW